MKKIIFPFVLNLVFFTFCMSANAKTICSMTFNSSDEREVFNKNLSPIGYEHIELVPENRDPAWFSKACAKTKTCDILVISGHFGGLFFGEKSSATISLNELINAREKSLCPNILDKPKSVFLMGCNTLSSKTQDHRSVDDYLHILVGDGFPLNLAEDVAASRYLNFGQSMSSFMTSIFMYSPMIVGFESTGPLGAAAAPRLESAFKMTSSKDQNITGLSEAALLSAFKDTNLKVVRPVQKNEDVLTRNALSEIEALSTKAWMSILSPQNMTQFYDFIIKNKKNIFLTKVLAKNADVSKNVLEKMIGIFQMASGLSHIQVNVLDFLKIQNLINQYEYEDSLSSISSNIFDRSLDYIAADQLCSILKDHQELNLLNKLNNLQKRNLAKSAYATFINKCAGGSENKKSDSKALRCLLNQETYDWACLTENSKSLDVDSCVMAKDRNADPENADDMMWYCYSKMLENKNLNRPTCLELTHHFSLLGNQIKMNWNCLNKIF